MILGKTDADRHADRQRWRRRYAVLPVALYDGRWAWLEPYWVRTSTGCPHGGPGVFLAPIAQRFTEIPEPREFSAPPPKRK